jgi:hypothetical protein
MQPARDWHGVDAAMFADAILPLNRPAVLRSLVADWPAVSKARQSAQSLADYLRPRCNNKPVSALVGAPEIHGRFFYRDDLQGFNFARQRLPLGKLMSFLLEQQGNKDAPALYAGAVSAAQHAPALLAENTLDLLPSSVPRQASLWIGNRTRVAAHWDHQHNVACVIGGRRRYTLFPTDQIKNLYIGPLDHAPAGVPISLVDFHRPDFERFPRFRDALACAEVAELGPGDALYMPSLWVHHAESLDDFGLMMNFWWQDWPMQQLSPFFTMLHALLTVRNLPPSVREGWRALFDLYVFQSDGDPMAHIPEPARGLFATSTPQRTLAIIAELEQSLGQLKAATHAVATPAVATPRGAAMPVTGTGPPPPR